MTPSAAQAPVAVITGAASGIGAACAALLRRSRLAHGGHRPERRRTPTCRCRPTSRTGPRWPRRGGPGRRAVRPDRPRWSPRPATTRRASTSPTSPSAQWDRMLAVILGGTVNCCAAVLPHMLSRGAGSHRGDLLRAGAGRQRDRPALRGGQGRGARPGQVAGHGGRADRASGSTRWRRARPTRRCWPRTRCGASPTTWPPCRWAGWSRPEEIAHAVYYLATEGSMYCGEVLSPNAGAVI